MHRLRLEVASQIAEQLDTGERISKAAHEADALRIITRWLENNENRRVQIGEAPLGPRLRDKVTAAVLDSTFGLGRIEPLLRPEVEDISVRGCDNVLVSLADGRVEVHAPVAESDQELTRDIQHFAANSPFGERSFSPAHPILEMPLPDGSRLAAAGFSISPRPILTIRRNRLSDIELADLVDLGSITPGIREFLTAAVRSGKNVVVSGLPAAGKTTMIRAMLNTLDKTVPLATIETEYELHLHELTHRHQNVVALQTRGGGEDGTGEVTLADLVRAALRHSVEILVVGEVRSWEILDMLAAMRAGKGSVSTVHAKTPIQTVDRLVECAMQAESAVTSESAYRQVASNLDLVVSLGVVDERPQGGRRHRFLQAIDAITLSEDARNHVAHTPIYAPGPDGRAIPTGNRPEWLEDLERWGFDPGWLSPQNAGWSTPLDLIRPYRGRA